LKLLIRGQVPNWADVAPRRGAWIETLLLEHVIECVESHPAGVRGLKPRVQENDCRLGRVAPRRGAWIETMRSRKKTAITPGRTPQGCVD